MTKKAVCKGCFLSYTGHGNMVVNNVTGTPENGKKCRVKRQMLRKYYKEIIFSEVFYPLPDGEKKGKNGLFSTVDKCKNGEVIHNRTVK